MAQRPQNRHLKPWPKGKSGHPGKPPGRPPGIPAKISEYVRLVLAEEPKPGETNAERVARVLMAQALKGDLKAIDMVADRSEGKATQSVEVTGAEGGPLEFADARSRLLGRLAARKPASDPADTQ